MADKTLPAVITCMFLSQACVLVGLVLLAFVFAIKIHECCRLETELETVSTLHLTWRRQK